MNLFRLMKLSRELSRMEKAAKANPSPSTFVDLAEAYNNLGWHAHTMRVAEEGLLLFPRSEELRKVHEVANKHLQRERVQELREKLVKAPTAKIYRELARIYSDLGDQDALAAICAECLGRFPDDEEVKRLTKEVSAGPTDGEGSRRRLANLPQKGQLANKSVAEAIAGIREGLGRMVDLNGVVKAAYIRGSKALVKGEIKDGRDPFLKTARVVAKASQRASRRMDLGHFSRGIIEGSFGQICICSSGDVCAAVQCEPGTHVERIVGDLQELVIGSLHAVGRKNG